MGCVDEWAKHLRQDPASLLDRSARNGAIRYLAVMIQDGRGHKGRGMTYGGMSFYEYYLRLLETEGIPGTGAVSQVSSSTDMPGMRYWNLGEALVQGGYTELACRAMLVSARRCEQARQNGADVDLDHLRFVYETVIELKFRQYLHRHRDVARRLNSAPGALVVLPDDLKIRNMRGFHIDSVDAREVADALLPMLEKTRDPIFMEAFAKLKRLGSLIWSIEKEKGEKALVTDGE